MMKKYFAILLIALLFFQQLGFLAITANQSFSGELINVNTDFIAGEFQEKTEHDDSQAVESLIKLKNSEVLSQNISGIFTTSGEERKLLGENILMLTGVNENSPQTSSISIDEEGYHHSLFISQVFIDGENDFITIINQGKDFQGKIMLKNKNRNQNLEIQLLAGESLILAKNSILFSGSKLQNLTLSLPKTVEVPLELLVAGEKIDELIMSVSQVKNMVKNQQVLVRNQKDSQHFDFINFSDSIATYHTQIENQNGQLDASQSNDSSEFQESQEYQSMGNLKITEVFFYKNFSWIEVSNLSDEIYEGDIQLQGLDRLNTQYTYTIKIPEKSSLLLTTKLDYLDEKVQYQLIKDKRTIDWKQDVNILLSYGTFKDKFFVHQDWVKKIKDTQASFQNVKQGDIWVTTRTMPDMRKYIRGTFVANPGLYLENLENIRDITQPYTSVIDIPNISENMCNDDTIVKIQEIFPGNASYPAFIELKFLDIPTGYTYLRLTGEVVSEEVLVEKEDESLWQPNKTLLIATSDYRDGKGIDSQISPNFNLTYQSGKLTLEGFDGQNRQVLDMVMSTALTGGRSLYSSRKAGDCGRNFDKVGDFSPGFEEKFLEFFKLDSEPKIEYVYITRSGGGGGGFSCPTKADLCPSPEPKKQENNPQTEDKDKTDIQKDNKQESSIDHDSRNYGLKIEHLVYNPAGADKNNESITLLLTQGGELDLKHTTLVVDGKKKKLNGLLSEGISQTIRGTFGFPNSSKTKSRLPVQIYLGNQLLDTYYYTFESKTDEKKLEAAKEGYKVFSVLDGDTFRYKDEDGKLQSVRLLGVDSPESNTARYKKTECYGKESKDYLTKLIKGKTVKLIFDEQSARTDSYGRLLAYVYLNDMLVNQHLIEKGYAKEYTYKIPYEQQSNFKSAELSAKEKKVGMWNPLFCPDNLKLAEEYENITQNLVLKIVDIDYDPKGTDKGNEKITLSVYDKSNAIQSLDFSQNFGLYLFDANGSGSFSFDDFEFGTGKYKDLSVLATFPLEKTMHLQGDFGLPNNKSTCIALVQKEHLFDIACYEVGEKSQEEQKEGKSDSFSGAVSILSILPNPRGKDSGKEFVQLLYQGTISELVLQSGFTLSVNGKKNIKLEGNIANNQPQNIYGNFNFPNDSACISLYHHAQLLDTFCYGKNPEGTVIGKSSTRLEQLEITELDILKQVKMKRIGSQICLTYYGEQLQCRKLPKTRVDPLLKTQVQVTASAMKTIENLLRKEYSPLYYQTDIVELFSLRNQAEGDIKAGKTTMNIGEKEYQWKYFDKIFQIQRERTSFDIGLELLGGFIPADIKQKYREKNQERKASLIN